MRVRSIVPSGYFVSGVASFLSVAAVLGATSAQAQTAATLNLQNQLNILLPSIAAPSPSSPQAEVAKAQADTACVAAQTTARLSLVSPSSAQIIDITEINEQGRRAIADPIQNAKFKKQIISGKLNQTFLQPRNSDFAAFMDGIKPYASKNEKLRTRLDRATAAAERAAAASESAAFAFPSQQPCAPPSLKIGVTLNPTYETDVLKTGNNSSPGASFGIGGTAQYTTPASKGSYDVIAVSAGTASSRYSDFPTKNVDAVSAQAFLSVLYRRLECRP